LPTAPENRLDSTLIHRHTAERQSTWGFIGWLVLAMASIYAKFEVSICTRYEDMKAKQNVKIGVVYSVIIPHPLLHWNKKNEKLDSQNTSISGSEISS